jgi:hypothetical protein
MNESLLFRRIEWVLRRKQMGEGYTYINANFIGNENFQEIMEN